MPKKNILRHKKDFDKIFKEGKLIRGKSFSLVFRLLPTEGTSLEPRFSVIVKKTLEKRATKRNKVKRRFKEILRMLIPYIPKGDYVFIAKPNVFQFDFKQLKEDITSTLKKTVFTSK